MLRSFGRLFNGWAKRGFPARNGYYQWYVMHQHFYSFLSRKHLQVSIVQEMLDVKCFDKCQTFIKNHVIQSHACILCQTLLLCYIYLCVTLLFLKRFVYHQVTIISFHQNVAFMSIKKMWILFENMRSCFPLCVSHIQPNQACQF